MAEDENACPRCVEKVIDFTDGVCYKLLRPLTNFRKNQDGIPTEGRILFTCQRIPPDSPVTQEDYVVKVKVQVPDRDQSPESGPSTTTSTELRALEIFSKADSPYAPHLVTWKRSIQGHDGLLPGGYLTYTVMTKMPGQNLLDFKYWSLSLGEREEIIQEFLRALRSIFDLGIQPLDCALRNVIWEQETKKCTIIDFELWQETKETIQDQTKELQRWGLARRPAPKSWWDEWNHK